MTGSRPDQQPPDDLDPTGVRALLANLPDPGPMPEDLVARITQSLALEQERRVRAATGTDGSALAGPEIGAGVGSQSRPEQSPDISPRTTAQDGPAVTVATPLPAEPATPSTGIISLDAERQRRRPGRTLLWLGGAAAVAMVATVGANQLLDGDSNDSFSAAVPAKSAADDGVDAGQAGDAGGMPAPAATEDGADDAGTGGGADDTRTEGEQGEVDAEPEATPQAPDLNASSSNDALADLGGGPLVFSSDAIRLSTVKPAEQVRQWLEGNPTQGPSSWSTQDTVDCIEELGLDVNGTERVVVADAEWKGEPAMVLVTDTWSVDTLWILHSDCATIDEGPLPLN